MLLESEYSGLESGCRVLESMSFKSGCWILKSGCGVLESGYGVLEVGCGEFESQCNVLNYG